MSAVPFSPWSASFSRENGGVSGERRTDVTGQICYTRISSAGNTRSQFFPVWH